MLVIFPLLVHPLIQDAHQQATGPGDIFLATQSRCFSPDHFIQASVRHHQSAGTLAPMVNGFHTNHREEPGITMPTWCWAETNTPRP